jgi:cytochrome c oxidase subunit II
MNATIVLTTAGCGSGDQSALNPGGGPARTIATLWWWMLGGALLIFAGAVGLLVLGWVRRGRPGFPLVGARESLAVALVVAFGIAIPLVTLIVVFVVSDIVVISKTDAPAPGSTAMTVVVVGHQWFWEVRYPGSDAVTANEIHIPVRTRVNLELRTADVIHSLWVPQLNRKADLIPGQTNRILFYADRPGVYRGQCAEFCGVQHAHMALKVFADPPDRFRSWLAAESQPRSAPSTPQGRQGEQVFLSHACSSCHAIRGTDADGTVGPDLTHLASRTTLAAVTIPNRIGYLGAWVADPQHVKPGNRMPAVPLGGGQLQHLLVFLESLR